jgi:hypothetical protein
MCDVWIDIVVGIVVILIIGGSISLKNDHTDDHGIHN